MGISSPIKGYFPRPDPFSGGYSKVPRPVYSNRGSAHIFILGIEVEDERLRHVIMLPMAARCFRIWRYMQP